jgi:AcrR family transcriptional regulator
MSMDRKTRIKRTIMNKFIDAASTIIDDEGLDKVTIRKVASAAGYNSATLYNYFDNIEHLIIFASIRYLRDYNQGLKKYVKNARNSLERYLLIWECFCKYSFDKPDIYNLIFFSDYSNSLNNIITEYYSLFPEELADSSLRLNSMLTGNNIYSRTLYQFGGCADEGYFREEDIPEINEVTILIYQSILQNLLKKSPPYDSKEALDKVMKYFGKIVESYRLPAVAADYI